MKHANILGTTVITFALGLATPMAFAEMHGDKAHKDDKKAEHTQNMEYGDKSDKDYAEKRRAAEARGEAPEANEIGERTDTSTGIEARPGSDGTDRAVPGAPDVGLDDDSETGN